ncbi:MAG: hypothetical protein J07HB67_00399 [halophilic archaeon J07HB67]|jgi:hypothetical protein|nr:MAG: hypothetical protein J07HB67_00399 [halophilic archaeon J07HB67]
MARQACDGCGDSVTVAGGIANLWTLEKDATGGIELELVDGTDQFLCYGCIERLPDDEEITADHVDRL